MSDPLRYRVIDEPRPGRLQRIALPPLLVFMVAIFFTPWGLLLIAGNALALNGAGKWREIGYVAGAIAGYFAALVLLNVSVGAGLIAPRPATYVFVACIGATFVLACFAYISQARTAELRRYLASGV